MKISYAWIPLVALLISTQLTGMQPNLTSGQNSLIEAVQMQDPDIIEHVFRTDAPNPNFIYNNMSPLLYAINSALIANPITQRHFDIIRILCRHGAKSNIIGYQPTLGSLQPQSAQDFVIMALRSSTLGQTPVYHIATILRILNDPEACCC